MFTVRRILLKEQESMKYSDYQVIVKREYEKNRKNIGTCYFFILLSLVFFLIFFFSVRELPIVGAAFLLDFAAAVYAVRAFKGLHPYWEMQYALKAKAEPTEANVCCFTAALELAEEKGLPAFKGRAPEIFAETWKLLKKSKGISASDMDRLETVLGKAGVKKN